MALTQRGFYAFLCCAPFHTRVRTSLSIYPPSSFFPFNFSTHLFHHNEIHTFACRCRCCFSRCCCPKLLFWSSTTAIQLPATCFFLLLPPTTAATTTTTIVRGRWIPITSGYGRRPPTTTIIIRWKRRIQQCIQLHQQ